MKRPLMVSALATVLSLHIGFALAADPIPLPENAQAQKQEQQEHIYGNQLMTPQERTEYRAKMQAAKTADEREQIHKKHYNAMRIRAKAHGVFLSDEPPVRGGGMMGPGGRRPR